MIIHLINYSAEYSGNFIPALLELSKKVYHEKNETSLLLFDINAKKRAWIKVFEQYDYIKVEFIHKSKTALMNTKCIEELINKNKDGERLIVHIHFGFDLESILLKFRNKQLKVFWHIHSGILKVGVKQKFKDLIKIRILANKYVDGIICVSDHIKTLWVSRGMNKEKSIVVYNGIDIEKNSKKFNKEEMKSKYGLPHDKIIALAFGYNPIIKGVDILLDSLRLQNNSNMLLVLIGRDELKTFIENYEYYNEIKDKIILMKPMEEIVELINSIEIFISSSRSEGFSYSIGEAMLNEKVAIISNIDGTSHYLNSNGVYSYDCNNCKQLSDVIKEIILLDSNDYDRLGRENRQYIIKQFSLKKWVNEIIRVYDN